jgi:hypothetical protein
MMKTEDLNRLLSRLFAGVCIAVLVACACLWAGHVEHQIDTSNGQLDATVHQVAALRAQLESVGEDFDKLAVEDQKKITTLESQLTEQGAQHRDRLMSLEQQLNEANKRSTIKFGAAAGYVFAGGEQRYQNFARLREYALDWVSVPATTWTTVYTMPALVAGELNAYAGLAFITYDNSDAAVNCDGGLCDGVIRRYVPGRYQGGDFCRPDGVCASAGSFDVSVDSYVTTTGISTGALARISWSSPNLVMQIFCPTTCRAAAGISGQAMKPTTDSGAVADSGTDAADAADAADSAGPVPTVTSMIPPIITATSPPNVAIIGTNFINGTTTFKFGASSATGVTCASNANYAGCTSASTCCVMTPPAYSGGTGGTSGTAQAVTAANGSSTGSGNVALWNPTGSAVPVAYHQLDSFVTGTVTAVGDLMNSNNWSGGTSPTQCTNFNGSGHNCVQFNGSSQFLTMGTPSPSVNTSGMTVCTTMSFATTATWVAYGLTSSSTFIPQLQAGASHYFLGNSVSVVQSSNASDTSAHIFCGVFVTGSSQSIIYVDNTATTGTLTLSGTQTNPNHWGANSGNSFFANMKAADFWLYPAAMTPTEIASISANAATAYLVP